MKKIFFLSLLFVVALSAGAKKTKQLVILHTNDTHSCILPLNANLADTMLAGRGGYVRRAAAIEAERKANPSRVLLFDSGDFSQGSAFYTLFKGDVEVDLMNLMGYDAATLGNHEFDFGLDNLAALCRRAKFPIVCANYDFTGTVCEGLVRPYVILKKNGLKIGVFGLSPKMEGLVFAKNYEGVRYLDPNKVALKTATLLKEKEHCDLVVCISHLGWKLVGDDNDNQMIAASRYIDIVLGGHSHSYFTQLEHVNNIDGKPVAVDQNGKHGVFVGKIEVELRVKN